MPEDRAVCPQCGSKARALSVGVLEAISLRATTVSVSATLESSTAPALLLQTVVVLGEKTSEGRLIEAVTIPWKAIVRAISSDPAVAYQIPAHKWEELIAGAYKQAGFDEVTLTPRSGDFGRDVIAVKRGLGVVRVIDQVKAYSRDRLVTANDVRALLGVLEGDKASKGFLTTTSDFAPRLREDILLKQFMPARLELIDGRTLVRRLHELLSNSSVARSHRIPE